jgi:dolichol kinase
MLVGDLRALFRQQHTPARSIFILVTGCELEKRLPATRLESIFVFSPQMINNVELTAGLDNISVSLMLFEAIFIPWLMLDKKRLSAFAARKLCHAGSGLIMMMLNCNVLLCRLFIYAVAVVSLTMNWELFPKLLPNFWFGAPRDKGITLYLLLVASWVYAELSLRILAPVFLADPAGAIVGKFMSQQFPKHNKKWIWEKTIAGSFAVFFVTFLSLHAPSQFLARCFVSMLAALGEAVGGPYDNLVIALVVVAASGAVL